MAKSIIRVASKIGIAAAFILTGVVFLYLCAVTFQEQRMRLLSRTVSERQFKLDAEPRQLDLRTVRGFESQHALNPETHGGLRLSIGEWPTWKYVISFQAQKDGTVKGAIQAVAYDLKGPTYERDFLLEKEEAKVFFDSFDREIDGYWGSMTQCTDGTGFQFERWDRQQISSGYGNAACQRHYAELMSLVAEALITKLNPVPFDWRSWFSSKRQLTLMRYGS